MFWLFYNYCNNITYIIMKAPLKRSIAMIFSLNRSTLSCLLSALQYTVAVMCIACKRHLLLLICFVFSQEKLWCHHPPFLLGCKMKTKEHSKQVRESLKHKEIDPKRFPAHYTNHRIQLKPSVKKKEARCFKKKKSALNLVRRPPGSM